MKSIPRPFLIAGSLLVLLIIAGILFLTLRPKSDKTVDSCNNTVATASGPNVFESCATVSGTVVSVSGDANGTLEVLLRPDRGDSSATVNQANNSNQNGNLLVILTCTSPTNTSGSYFNSCGRFEGTYIVPGINQRIRYTGIIKTNPRFGWNELYPVFED